MRGRASTTAIGALATCAALAILALTGSTPSESTPSPATAPPAAVATSLAGTVTRAEWLATSRRLSGPIPSIQRRDGSLRDAFGDDGSSRYGDAMLGYALIQTGARDGDRRLVLSGIRAVDVAARTVDPWFATRGFEVWGVAAAYNVVRARLAHLPQARAALDRWGAWLGRQYTTFLHYPGFENKHVVDAVAVLEAQRTGVRSDVPGAILGTGREVARRQAANLIERVVPRQMAGGEYVLSDPEEYPIAYHAISYAAYAHAARLLGVDRRPEPAAALRRLGRIAWRVTAPDGEIAYWGRSMAQSWTLPALAYGLAVTAAGTTEPWRSRYRAVAHRVLRRLAAYGAGPRGEWTTPSLRQDVERGRRSLDPYARSTEYTGLALVYLNLAIPLLPERAPLGRIAADGPTEAIVGQGTGRFAVVRRGDVWLAVRELGGRDLRYDFGPVAVKRLEDGVWRDVVPLRPYGGGTAGPVLLQGSDRGAAVGSRIAIAANGTVTVAGRYRTTDFRVLRDRATFQISPTGCGVRLTATARAGDLLEFSAFFRGDRGGRERPRRQLRAFGQVVTGTEPFTRIRFGRGWSSASDADLSRARLQLRARSAGPLGVTIC